MLFPPRWDAELGFSRSDQSDHSGKRIGSTKQRRPSGEGLTALLPRLVQSDHVFEFIEHGLNLPPSGVAFHNLFWGESDVSRGSDRWIKSNTGRKRVNLLGSYSPISTTTEILQTTEPCTADTVIQLLEQIRQACPRANRIVVIMDNVRYQRAKKVKEYAEHAHIELLYLPSYSPNLNLIERLWDYLKDLLVRNHYYETFILFCAMISSTLKMLKDRKAEWLSRMTENFQILNCS